MNYSMVISCLTTKVSSTILLIELITIPKLGSFYTRNVVVVAPEISRRVDMTDSLLERNYSDTNFELVRLFYVMQWTMENYNLFLSIDKAHLILSCLNLTTRLLRSCLLKRMQLSLNCALS